MNKGIIITIGVTVSIIGLFAWGNNSQKNAIINFKNTEVYCLTNGHQSLADHIHPELEITIDGEPETIPSNIGIDSNCMSEIHTHDSTGIIHIESVIPGRVRDFNMSHFFSVWDKSHIRDGYDLEIIQDGETKNSIEDVEFIDLSKIEFKYTTKNSDEVSE
jgi:hypothetical protein